MNPVLLETRGLRKYFDLGAGRRVHAVDGIDLVIREGEVLGLVGESGSGKSTLGKTIIGLHPRTSGDILFHGQPLPAQYTPADYRRMASQMQMVFQDPYSSLNPRMTVEEIISEALALRGGFSKEQIRDRVAFWLQRVGLNKDHMVRYPHEFSGGQRQRIGIARAMIAEPRLVICDEPISALDVSIQAQVVNLLADLKQSLGLTMIFIAHDLSMVRFVSDRIAVMYLGAICEIGPADEVFFNPRHPYSQALIASNPKADPDTEKARPHQPIPGEIPSPVNLPKGCRFAARCPLANDRCREESPLLREISPDHHAACHLI